MSIANYDVKTYNSGGRIIQVEYAMKAMNTGPTTIGIRLKDSVILVSQKQISNSLQVHSSIKRHYKIYDTILAGVTGIIGDAPTIIKKTRNICLDHEKIFKEQIDIHKLMEDLCDLALKFSEEKYEEKIFSRPFGVSVLMAAYQNKRPILYNINPSGSYLEYKAKAIGSAHEVLETILQDEYENFTDEDASIKKALEIMKGVVKDKINENNVEISVVRESGIQFLTPSEILAYIQ